MASIAFGGVLLLTSGVIIIFVSMARHLIEIFIILGVILAIIGFYLLIISFLNRHGKTTKLQEFKKNLKNSKINNSNELNKNNVLRNNNLSNNHENNTNNDFSNTNTKADGETHNKKPNSAASLGNSLANNKLALIDTKKITEKVKDASKNRDPKFVLKPKKPKSNTNTNPFKFTPNYERPVKVTRRPKKRIKPGPDRNAVNINNIEGGKSETIAKALASDDFISPIHTEFKSNQNLSNESKLNQISNSGESIESKIKSIASKGNDSNSMNDDNNDSIIKKANENIDNINDFKFNEVKLDDYQVSGNEKKLDDNKDLSKFLRSYVVCSKGTMTSKEAFGELAKNAKNEILLEMSSIKDMDNKFFSKISSLNVRIIIEEFDIKDMSYVLLITSLLEQGMKIRTLPLINTINLIADDFHALIISETYSTGELDIGAVYNDQKSISNIKSMFEKSWNLANDLDINNLTGL
ncbi:hypothetical protein ALNOE001_08560 [Candidatus Methanobinarius endosymbioticus]|uniref:Uncharacterized protein n=1 Tax=Candidatus Methanobinarius endosymbioticus TaxID=2006182 RepID=A0A366MDM0_9EURY|nr:hypothetical protein ALNOE001_08560 [Candidatus Methanobinarius endosymbioticus]